MHRIQAAGTIDVQSHMRAFHFGANSNAKTGPPTIIANYAIHRCWKCNGGMEIVRRVRRESNTRIIGCRK